MGYIGFFPSGYHGYAMGHNPRIYCRFRMRKATVNSTGRNGIPYFGQPHVGQGWSQKDLSWEIVEPVGNENEMKGHQKTTVYVYKQTSGPVSLRTCRSMYMPVPNRTCSLVITVLGWPFFVAVGKVFNFEHA